MREIREELMDAATVRCEWPVYDPFRRDRFGYPERRTCARNAGWGDRAVNLCAQHDEMWWLEMVRRVGDSDNGYAVHVRGRDRLRAALLLAEERRGVEWMSEFFQNIQLGDIPESALAYAAARVIRGEVQLSPYDRNLIDCAIEDRMRDIFQ